MISYIKLLIYSCVFCILLGFLLIGGGALFIYLVKGYFFFLSTMWKGFLFLGVWLALRLHWPQ